MKTLTTTIIGISIITMLSCGCRNRSSSARTSVEPQTERATASEPARYTYRIVNTYPHDTGAYTQGLEWRDGFLWEGTGKNGSSALRKVRLETGEPVTEVKLDDRYFGEGITILGDKIYQLTWHNQTAFVYELNSLRPAGQFRYTGEGWGLTNDSEHIYMSDGTFYIRKIDPSDFSVVEYIPVKIGRNRLELINELEWIEGKIWANIYTTDFIVIIDPVTGAVEGIIDLDGILPAADRTPDTDVLNGIAYDSDGDRVFVTGKNWNKLFEIEILPLN